MSGLERIAAAMRGPDSIVVRLAARGATVIADVERGEPSVTGAVFGDLGADEVLRLLRDEVADALEAGGCLDAAELLRDERRLRACLFLIAGPRDWRDAPERGLVLTVRAG